MDYKLDVKTAQEEFETLCEVMEVDADPQDLSEEEEASFSGIRRTLIKGIRLGRVALQPDETIVFTQKYNGGGTVTMTPSTGAVKQAVDSVKAGRLVGKSFAMLGAACGCDAKVFANMHDRDLKFIESAFVLFLNG